MSKPPLEPNLLADDRLQRSDVVANSTMNRRRGLSGANSYEAELRMSPLTFLKARRQSGRRVTWLDLCCGSGRALIEAARQVQREGWEWELAIVGIDLVAMFEPCVESMPGLSLRTASLHDWTPEGEYDLITCVHGLHYVGDKLALISRIATCLAPDGLFIANLDLANLQTADGKPLARRALKVLRETGFTWDARQRLVKCDGPRKLDLPFRYLGADDQAGPNYTGQAAVNSYYAISNTW